MTKVETSKLSATGKSPSTASSSSASSGTSTLTTATTTSSLSKESVPAISTTSADTKSAYVVASSSAETISTASSTASSEPAIKTNDPSTSSSSSSQGVKQDAQSTLTTVELQLLSELDSTQFGFVRLTEEINARKKVLVLKAIKYLERFIVRSRERQRRAAAEPNNNGKNRPNEVNPSLYCKLGHLHLLLENFSKALSAYQTYFRLKKGILNIS